MTEYRYPTVDTMTADLFTAAKLNSSLAGLGLPPSDELFAALRDAYTTPDRHYHNERHIAACLRHLYDTRAYADRPAEIGLAIWFHDAVYDTRRRDNEEQSAAWVRDFLAMQQADPVCVARIVNLIMATKAHEASTGDEALLVDIDLAILGASPDMFEAYDAAVRREYGWVPGASYRQGRAAVLGDFLARPAIYRTRPFWERYEQQARENLQRKIAELRSS